MINNNPKECDVQRAICEYLTLRKHFFWRNNNVPIVQFGANGKGRYRRMPKYAIKGVPDLFVALPIRTIALEVKRAKGGTVSPEQRVFAEYWHSPGACREYYIVRSIEDVQKVGL